MGYYSNSDGSAFYRYGDSRTEEEKKHIKQMLDFMEKVYINPKVEGFVDSIRDYFFKHDFLTERQYEALKNIYERI